MASGFAGLPTEFYEIKKYENEIITLERIDVETNKKISSGKKKSKEKSHIVYTEYTEEDYLSGKYETTTPDDNTKELWFKLKDRILTAYDDVLEYKQRKKYGGFYSKVDNACICTLDSTKSAIWISYSITKENFFDYPYISYTTKGHFGVGYYRSKIQNSKDIEKVLPRIHDVLNEKGAYDDDLFEEEILEETMFG